MTTTLGKRLKSNSYLTAFLLRVGSSGLQKSMISWRQVFWNSSQRHQVKATCTPCLHFEAGWGGSRVKQQPSMNSFGHLGIEDTKIVCQLHGMCCFKGSCLAQWVYWDVLFQRLLPGTMGVLLPKMRDQTKRMITILE